MSYKPFFIFGIIFFVLVSGFAIFLATKTPEQILTSPVVKNVLLKKAGLDKKELVDLLPHFLGFQKPQTYLILFANNTEMRPGGGFLGTYATVRIINGKAELLAVEGTEVLDRRTPALWKPIPPQILQEKLGVDRWYFRDSNWSPDYAINVKKALEFYKAEGGVAREQIDAVLTFTPTVLEKLLEITGPLTIEGIIFNAQNVTRELEHEVEYGFKDKGISFENRKKIIEPFFHALLRKVGPDMILHSEKYSALFDELAKEKQVLAYFQDPIIQKIMREKDWSGEVKVTSGDYLLWVDANLGALKTDAVLKRNLFYSFQKEIASNQFIATAKMEYRHTGVYDKFTSRYRTYSRVYVPIGSKLLSVKSFDKNGAMQVLSDVDQGVELEKQWFGTFFSIEPGEIKELEFRYVLPQNVKNTQKEYSLLVQKQAGLQNAQLTLHLNFGTTIQSANPPEDKKDWGDSIYKTSLNFLFDEKFEVKF